MNEEIVDALGLLMSVAVIMACADKTPPKNVFQDMGHRTTGSLIALTELIGGPDLLVAVSASALTTVGMVAEGMPVIRD